MQTAYEKLKDRFDEIINLDELIGFLTKESEVDMPPGAEADRSHKMEILAKFRYRLISDPAVKYLLDEAERAQGNLKPDDRRNLFLMRRQWQSNTALSEELTARVAVLQIEGQSLHTKNRASGNWEIMRPVYQRAFDTMREVAQARMEKMPGVFATPYEALLDMYSSGLKEADIDREFSKLEKALPPLIREIMERQAATPQPLPLSGKNEQQKAAPDSQPTYPRALQEKLCRRLAEDFGYDFARGRMNMIDAHPSSSGTQDYAWFTVDCDEEDFLRSVYGTIHEVGHATYSQNLPAGEYRYQPAGQDMGMFIHETQSRQYEVQVGHSPEFFQYLSQLAQDIFNRPGDPRLDAKNLERIANVVKPTFIRTEADEVTYGAHVIIRTNIERDIINGKKTVDDIPAAWNEGYKKFLGIEPSGPAEGHMQDVHWPCLLIGYFPDYELGNEGAAQMDYAVHRAVPGVAKGYAKGQFKAVVDWRRENIHSKGSLLPIDDLLTQATGETLNSDYKLDHLSRRYLGRPWTGLGNSSPQSTPRP